MTDMMDVTTVVEAYAGERVGAEKAAGAAKLAALQAEFDQYIRDHPTLPAPGPGKLEMIFGGATSNNQADFDKLNSTSTGWGPIRAACEYDSGKSFEPITSYAWFQFVKRNFKYLRFSADPQSTEADYRRIPTGVFDAKIKAMLDSVPANLPGVRGVYTLGNEPNAGKKDITPATWKKAMEYMIDKFGPYPAPGFFWGIAYTNFQAWGQGRTDGAAWLPDRDVPFVAETHFYGKDDYNPPAEALRTLLAEVRKHPKMMWSLGEMSAQEDPGNTKKAKWFTDVGKFAEDNGAVMFLPFDTGVGGSAPINTSEPSRKAMQAIAARCASNEWPKAG